MADLKISQLTAITTLTPATDVLPVVDVTGTTKKITTNQLLGSGGTATLASATITGDLTVDTSTLKVDSANDRVGVGTASPAAGAKLGVLGATSVSASDYILASTWAARFTGSSNNASSGISFLTYSSTGQPTPASIHATPIADYRSALIATYAADSFGAGYFAVNRYNNAAGATVEHYKIDNAGVATWSNVGGVAGTAMTLNAGGLAIGTATNYGKLSVAGSIASFASATIGAVSANSGYVVYSAYAGAGAYISLQPTNSSGTQFEAARIDTNGNLILSSSTVPATLASNYQLTLNATSNTNLRFSYRGSDGVTRVANITLA